MARTGKIYLAKNIKMDKNYKAVLNYTEAQMISLITDQANLVYSATNYSFIRDRGTIQVNALYSQAVQCNYMAFQNPDYSGKWFFAFIDEVKYLSPNSSEIVYTIDVWSTWWDYWTPKACLVLREHVVDDTLGANTVPEGLELGEYVINSHLRDSHLRDTKIVLASTVSPYELVTMIGGTYNGIYSGVVYYTNTAAEITSSLSDIAGAGKLDGVESLFLAPDFLIPQTGGGVVISSYAPYTYDLGLSPITTLNGYTPVNQKMLTFPYCYILTTNANGGSAIYHQELFTAKNQSGEFVFRVYGSLTPGCSIREVPINYKGSEVNTDEGLNLGKYPQLNWATDMFTNWVTQNGLNVATNLAVSGVEIAAGASTGNVAIAAKGVVSGIHAMDEVRKAHLIPPQTSGNINCGDVITSMRENTFHYYRMTIKSEFASRIDSYFTRYGYRVNQVKQPNMLRRQNYNFIQIAEEENLCYPNNHNNICLPARALDQINTLFRNGITIWNNHTNFGDYSVSNGITQN